MCGPPPPHSRITQPLTNSGNPHDFLLVNAPSHQARRCTVAIAIADLEDLLWQQNQHVY
jgi:hypothetical protein